MAEQDTRVVTVGVHEFPGEVLVEVTRRDDEGYIAVRSYQFRENGGGLAPLEPVPDDLEEAVRTALTEKGYEYAAE